MHEFNVCPFKRLIKFRWQGCTICNQVCIQIDEIVMPKLSHAMSVFFDIHYNLVNAHAGYLKSGNRDNSACLSDVSNYLKMVIIIC